MKHSKKVGAALFLSLLGLTMAYASDFSEPAQIPETSVKKVNSSSEPVPQNPPSSAPAMDVASSDELEDILDQYVADQDIFLTSKGKNYQMAYGLAEVNGSVGTESYVLALESAYSLALNEAYGNLAREIGAERISKEVSTTVKNTVGDKTAFMSECEEKIEDREKATVAGGYAGGVLATISAFTGVDIGDSIESLSTGVIECSDLLDARQVTQLQKSTVEDVFTGTRVFQTVILDSQIGVVVGYSPDTAEVAAILANQNTAARPLPTAKQEVREWVESQVANQSGSKLGLFGSRMKRLSNGEWAVIGFAVAPHFQTAESGGILDRQKNKSMRNQSKLSARSELSKFANLSITYSEENKQVDSNTRTLEQVLNNKGNETKSSKEVLDSVLASQMTALSNSSSSLELRGASSVFSKKIDDEELGVSFYLSAHAWSPSMLANINQFSSAVNASVERGSVTTGSETMAKEEKSQGSNGYRSMPVLTEDW